MSSFTPIDVLTAAFADYSAKQNTEKLLTGATWNGDINFASLNTGDHEIESILLALDQKMMLDEASRKKGELAPYTEQIISQHFSDFVTYISSRSDETKSLAYNLMFRYLFYLRSIRVPGKQSRLLFWYMYSRLYNIFPETCLKLLELVPDYGYFGDIDALIEYMSTRITDVAKYEQFKSAAIKVYIVNLNADSQLIFGKPLNKVSLDEAKELNFKLKLMSVEDIRKFVGSKRLSLASKWIKREGKDNSTHRNDIIYATYFPNGGIKDLIKSDKKEMRELGMRRLRYHQMLFRNVITALSQCLLVGEQMMCEENEQYRQWSSIPIADAPAKFITKYRKGLANELVNVPIAESDSATGNRHPDKADRVTCRKNLTESVLSQKIKGATQDIKRLSNIIYSHIEYGQISSKLSTLERLTIKAQWNDMVLKLRTEINDAIEQSKSEGEFIDPRNVIPVIDTSGSMRSARVQDVAIGLGIFASYLSTMPGCLMSFSEKPEIFKLDMSGSKDVFDHFLTVQSGPTGLSTNIDATYKLLLNLMEKSDVKSPDFAMLFLTDGQFDSQVVQMPRCQGKSHEQSFNDVFLGRFETAFAEKGYNLPRTIFWNLNCHSPGFPATAISKGVQLVSGYSQTLLVQVFTGSYTYEKSSDGKTKVSVTPWEKFVEALQHSGYDQVSNMLALVGEGCLVNLRNSD